MTTDELCYQSACALPSFEDEFTEVNEAKYKVQVEAIVYLAQNRSKFDVWELDILCSAPECTLPNVFQGVKDRLSGDTSNLAMFPSKRPTRSIRCYTCSCTESICPCTTYGTFTDDNTFCTIARENFGQLIFVDYGVADKSSTTNAIREFPFVLVEEAIDYSESTGRWTTQPEIIVYGCDWDLCNRPELLSYLPSSFQMRLSETWLNESVLGTGQPVRDCHQCPDEAVCSDTEFIDGNLCPIQSCNTTCLLSDLINDPLTNKQCYQSFCAPPDSGSFSIAAHRVIIGGVLYRSRPTTVDVWEIDIYCRADNCSRPEIFKELREELKVVPGDLSLLFNQTSIENPRLRCYNCYCEGDQGCTCEVISVSNALLTHCIIERNYDGENVYVSFTNFAYDPISSKYRDFPYVRVKESISYDNETGQWVTRPDEITYGCNWDYCNKPSLLSLLPASFQMRLDDSWLNSSILGDNEPVHECSECPAAPVCSVTGDINSTSCPSQSCNTTCFVSVNYNEPPSADQCYQSFCLPEESDAGPSETHRVIIEGAVYGKGSSDLELWEINLYCRVDDCSRPDIFTEIRQNLTVQTGDLTTLFNQNTVSEPNQLRCYDCYCDNDPICACNKTIALPANETYCTIIREYDGQNFWVILEHIDIQSTRVAIREFPYMLVAETILYDDMSRQWVTRPTLIVYGCNTDFCNDPRLVPRLPISFQMRLSEAWLNTNVLGTGAPVRDCHECPDAPQCGTSSFLNVTQCPITACNTTCLVSDTFDDPAKDELCYQSFCAPPDSDQFIIDPHRVEIAGILYGNQLDAQVELWEVNIYCRADNCSDPSIFKSLQANLTVDTGDLSAFFNLTYTVTTTPRPIEPSLLCYDCACYDQPDCSCTTVAVSGAYSSYCTIIRTNTEDGSSFIDLEHIDRNSTRVYIRKFPFILAEESIIYNESVKTWNIRTNLVVYGCNTNLCNRPDLVPLLPNSFQMTLSTEWLNTNVLGTGAPLRDCHECPDAAQCGSSTFLDVGRCPVQACNTTCLVSDIYDDPTSDEFCYQSFCAPTDIPQFTIDPHRVDLEGLIYRDQPNKVELWEIDIYCRADDCSRPEIFDELRANLTVQIGNLGAIFNDSTEPEAQLACYDCFCFNEPNCVCNNFTISDAKTSYCVILREFFGDLSDVSLGRIDRNSTRVYIEDFPYLLTEESIIYNDSTKRWITRTNLAVFGCNWDRCNDPRLVPYLPDSFQMRMSDNWLNTNVLGTGQPVRDCHQCPNGPVCSTNEFIDGSQCPIQPCNTTCLVSDIFDNPANNLQCYDSFCAPPNTDTFIIDPHRMELEGILYLCPIGRPVELWEIDIYCRANDCSRPEIFKEVSYSSFAITLIQQLLNL